MNNKEQIAKWRKLHKRTKLALTHEIAGLMLDMLEQQQAQIDGLTQERDRFRAAIDDECLNWQFTVDEENPRESMRQLLNITATIARDPSVCEEAANFALEQQLKGAALLVHSVNETGQFSWSDSQWLSDWLEEWEEQLKNGSRNDE